MYYQTTTLSTILYIQVNSYVLAIVYFHMYFITLSTRIRTPYASLLLYIPRQLNWFLMCFCYHNNFFELKLCRQLNTNEQLYLVNMLFHIII